MNRKLLNAMLLISGGSTRFVTVLPMYPFNCPATSSEIAIVQETLITLVLENIPQLAVSIAYSLHNITDFVIVQMVFSLLTIIYHL